MYIDRNQVRLFVVGCFDMSKDLPAFKKHLRDFLVELKEFASEDNADLYLEESLAASQQKLEQERSALLAVPGLIHPQERPDDISDL
jgi:exportin-1